jgi:hypothetical protein
LRRRDSERARPDNGALRATVPAWRSYVAGEQRLKFDWVIFWVIFVGGAAGTDNQTDGQAGWASL